MKKNNNLRKAQKKKNDEFYTPKEFIEQELYRQRPNLVNKVILLNGNDGDWSEFYKYFKLQFDIIPIKKLISLGYTPGGNGHRIDISRDDAGKIIETKTELSDDGGYASPSGLQALEECDVVVTNPPFSLFREFVPKIIDAERDLIVVGPMIAPIHKTIWPYIKEYKLHFGNTPIRYMLTPTGNIQKFGNLAWFSTFPNIYSKQRMDLIWSYKKHPDKYPKYDNIDAINVNKVSEIPDDYCEPMGVPISILQKLDPAQFHILGITNSWDLGISYINGKATFTRVVIQRTPEDCKTRNLYLL